MVGVGQGAGLVGRYCHEGSEDVYSFLGGGYIGEGLSLAIVHVVSKANVGRAPDINLQIYTFIKSHLT
jgi:hypothetical protein